MAGGKRGTKTKTCDAVDNTQNGGEISDTRGNIPNIETLLDSDTLADAIIKAFSSTDVVQRLKPILTEALKDSVTETVLSHMNDVLDLELKSRDKTIADLQHENGNLKAEIEDLEQYSRRNCLIIHGLEEKEGEDTDRVIQNFAKSKLKIDLKDQDIDRSHRLGRPYRRPAATGTRESKNQKPRPVIIKFTRYNARSDIYSAKKHLRGSQFYIHENLTTERQKWLKLVKERYPTPANKVWTLDGRIHVKTANGLKLVFANKENISKLKNGQ